MASGLATERRAALFDDLVRCETRLYNALGERLRAEHGIATSQFEVLRYVRDHPGARVADLAANFAAGVGAMSKGADRLVARGWVVRHANPADGRSFLLSLTTEGAMLLADAEATFTEALGALVAPALADDQVEAAGVTLSALRHSLEDAGAGLPVG